MEIEPTSCRPIEALNQALCREEEAQAFYEEMADRTLNLQGAEVFKEMAADAKAHADILREQIESITKSEAWNLPECVLTCELSPDAPSFPHDLKAQRQAIRPDASEMEALLYAIQKENETYDYYIKHVNAAEDPQAQQLYQYFAEEARQRFQLYSLNYDSASGREGFV